MGTKGKVTIRCSIEVPNNGNGKASYPFLATQQYGSFPLTSVNGADCEVEIHNLNSTGNQLGMFNNSTGYGFAGLSQLLGAVSTTSNQLLYITGVINTATDWMIVSRCDMSLSL
jgi:hypothetical protein